MRQYTLEPKTKGVSGRVVINLPTYAERLKFAKEAGVSGDDLSGDPGLGIMIGMLEKIHPFIEKIDLDVDGEKIDTFEELEMYQKGTLVINEIIAVVTGGIPSKGKS